MRFVDFVFWWEPKFLAEIMAERDPRVAPTRQPAAAHLTVADFLDRYYTSYVEAEGLRSKVTIKGRLKAVKGEGRCSTDLRVSVSLWPVISVDWWPRAARGRS